MDFKESPHISMNFYGFLWISMDFKWIFGCLDVFQKESSLNPLHGEGVRVEGGGGGEVGGVAIVDLQI